MSRIAKQPVPLGEGVTWKQDKGTISVKGAKAELTVRIPYQHVTVSEKEGALVVTPKSGEPEQRAAAGLVRSLLANLVQGVKEDFTKELEFTGVGYRVQVEGEKIVLHMGYSHPVELAIPKGLAVAVKKNVITVSGPDLQAVGQFAANIRDVRPPEPYKGKGIHYVGEHIRRKAGKAGKAAE